MENIKSKVKVKSLQNHLAIFNSFELSSNKSTPKFENQSEIILSKSMVPRDFPVSGGYTWDDFEFKR